MQPFILYNPNNAISFHTTVCKTIRNAQQIGTIKDFVRVPVGKKLFIMHDHTLQKLPECQNCIDNKLAGITGWNGIMPTKFIWPDCFLLYTPAAPGAGFHFMKCKKVCNDLGKGWTGAYRFTNKSWFEDYDGNVVNVEPCKDCLSEWDNGNGWKGDFSIYGFFDYCFKHRGKYKEFPPDLKDLYELMKDDKILIGAEINNKYPNNWEKISEAYRMSRDYRCNKCGVFLKEYPGLTVAHHVNGCHFDVRAENIRVLCKECHKKQLYHGRLVNIPNTDSRLLEKIRKEQEIKIP